VGTGRSASILWFLLLGTLVLPSQRTAAAADGIGGSYEGRYQCGDWHKLDLQIRDLGSGRISAVFTFPVTQGRAGGDGSYSMVGQFDERSRRFQLAPQAWLRRAPGYNMVGLEGVFDPASRSLRGKVGYFGCGAFELAPQGVPLAALPQAPRPLPPERRKAITTLTNLMPSSLEYWDAAMDAPGKARESEPIDDVIDWLKAQDFSCLGTRHVSWSSDGTQGTANDRVDVRERYVIECTGDCSGLHYMPYVQATIFHFGATQPVPVMEFKGIWFGGTNFQWRFTKTPGSKSPPDVYVHRWSSAKMLSGQNCRAPKTSTRQ
jgi:hypothetical protein